MKLNSILSTFFLLVESLYELFDLYVVNILQHVWHCPSTEGTFILENTMQRRHCQTHAVTHLRTTFTFFKIHVLPVMQFNIKTMSFYLSICHGGEYKHDIESGAKIVNWKHNKCLAIITNDQNYIFVSLTFIIH